jgi:hypothetical protein
MSGTEAVFLRASIDSICFDRLEMTLISGLDLDWLDWLDPA